LSESRREDNASFSFCTKKFMLMFLTVLETENNEDLLTQLQTNEQILSDSVARKRLLDIVLKWEPIISRLGSIASNKYFLRNRLMNPELYDFLKTLKEINHICRTYPTITVHGTYTAQVFCELMRNYDEEFEKNIVYIQAKWKKQCFQYGDPFSASFASSNGSETLPLNIQPSFSTPSARGTAGAVIRLFFKNDLNDTNFETMTSASYILTNAHVVFNFFNKEMDLTDNAIQNQINSFNECNLFAYYSPTLLDYCFVPCTKSFEQFYPQHPVFGSLEFVSLDDLGTVWNDVIDFSENSEIKYTVVKRGARSGKTCGTLNGLNKETGLYQVLGAGGKSFSCPGDSGSLVFLLHAKNGIEPYKLYPIGLLVGGHGNMSEFISLVDIFISLCAKQKIHMLHISFENPVLQGLIKFCSY
jgi:hypothetical protein